MEEQVTSGENITAEDWFARQAANVESLAKKAKTGFMQEYYVARTRAERDAAKSKYWRKMSMLADSEWRLEIVLWLLRKEKASPLSAGFFLGEWTCCDDTWPHLKPLVSFLRRHRRYFPKPDEAPIELYRGCSLERVKGVSWTSDRAIAERFAHGHRWIAVPNPVIATATVPLEAIFAGPLNERNEAEYLIDPKFIVASVQPYVREEREQAS